MQPVMQTMQAPRAWHQHFCCWCGDCDGEGWASCCLSYWCPCVSIGWNRQRAFAKNGVLWGLAFGALVVAYMIVSEVGKVTECEYEHGEKECRETIGVVGLVIMPLIGIALFAIGYVNRMQIRQRFGLPGDGCTDCLLWFFCWPCALCQETRTLMRNQVQNGVWQGPPSMQVVVTGQPAMSQGGPVYPPTAPPQFQPPPPQGSFDTFQTNNEYERKPGYETV